MSTLSPMLRMSGVTTMSDVEERSHSRGDLLSIASVSHDASGMNERQREREERERERIEREEQRASPTSVADRRMPADCFALCGQRGRDVRK